MNKTVIIQGSARSKGHTYLYTQELRRYGQLDFIDLKDYDINQFDYTFANKTDDFLPLITRIIDAYDTLVFASPVYWYSMSGHIKVFFDRISDLLYEHKDVGRKLRGKSMATLSVSNDDDVVDSFYQAFRLSAGYLGMAYKGEAHVYGDGLSVSEGMRVRLQKFHEQVVS